MKYCTKCLMPDTKPYISFDEQGVCAACRAHERKNLADRGIDWAARSREFDVLIEKARTRKAPLYDALVPVSGGKDSISQVHRLLGRGLRILAVNVDYGIRTEIGRRNLACIPRMGANLITYTPAQPLHRRLIRLGFEEYGDPDLLSHTMLHAFPLRMAMQLGVPLVLNGENSAFEYSGEDGTSAEATLTREWFDKYAANAGNTPRVVAQKHGIPYAELVAYDYPEEFERSGTRAVFCSHYFHWDSEYNLSIARQYGFEALPHPAEGTYRDYVGIDERVIHRVHQYFKVLKLGYGRATDHACEDIRNGRLTREAAKKLVLAHDLAEPSEELVKAFVEHIGITRARFQEVMEHYRNPAIWRRSRSGSWGITGHLED
jgi:N-acetyl sugar amidotransferase